MSKPGGVKVQCGNADCMHNSVEPFFHQFWASFNETIEGRSMGEDEIRDLAWATCPLCGTANFIGDDYDVYTMVWSW